MDDDVPALASDLRLTIGHLARRVRAESSVPLGQLAVLGLLDREGPQTTSGLAARQLVRHQSMARTVAQLVAAGQVEPQPHPTDRRKTELAITPAGSAVLEAERERRVDWLADALGDLTPAERRTLAAGTAILRSIAGGAPS